MSASPQSTAASEVRFGLIAGLAAYTLWGVFPVYLKALDSVSAYEILAHRILWSLPFAAAILTLRRQWPEVIAGLCNPRVLIMLMLAALAIAGNWCIYVLLVLDHHVLQASLGYYINPLMYMAAGVIFFKERLRTTQIAAIALAAAGVVILAAGGGVIPWASLVLAVMFTAYGYIRKTTNVGALPGLFIEVVLLSPIALLYLFWLVRTGQSAFLSGQFDMDALLILAGPVTVIPLVCFALSARRLQMTTIGFLQYIAPTLQFLIGLYSGEHFSVYHGICFGMIWAALALFSLDAARTKRADRLAPA